MKGWSAGFPTTLQLFKTRERQLWGQLTAGSGISKHGEDGVTSKTNPAHTIPLQEMKRRRKRGERRRAGWTVTTSKSLRSFVNVFFFGVIVSFWLPLHLSCCFLLFVKSDAEQTPESNLKTQMFDRKSNKCGHSVPTFPELRVYLVLNSRKKKNKAALVNGTWSLRINK